MILKKENLIQALSVLAKDAALLVPVNQGETVAFTVWDGKTAPYLEGNSTLPPKDALFPKTEKMYRYNTKNGELNELSPEGNQIVFGIRPCDVRSIENMDKVFLEEGYTDSYYKKRRELTTLISLGCTSPARTCFCDSIGGNCTSASGADMELIDSDGVYSVSANTPKGEAILKAWDSLLTDGEIKSADIKCQLKVNWDDALAKKLYDMFDSPMWEDISRACLGCGTCTYVCPTCYCFDIAQDTHGADGTAFRCWDSCMFSEYSRMAGGHNPRPSKKERLRNRYLHKLSYFDERYGKTLCVGCGRCMTSCPANLDISLFIDSVKEVSK